MKSFVISAIIGAAALVVKRSLAETLAKAKRGTDETCWETDDGQVECWKAKVKRGTDETCWETDDGQVERWKAKRDSEETCWETPDGQVECWKVKEKRGKLPPPGLIANGTTTHCVEWYLVSNHTAQSAQCLLALVAGHDITFAQFRELNPTVNANCSNLNAEYAYCVRDKSQTDFTTSTIIPNVTSPSPPVPKPYLPAILVTELRTGPGIFGAAASSTAGLADTLGSGSNNDFSGSGSFSYTTFFPSWNSSAAASRWSSQLASASDTPFPLTTTVSVSSPAAASSATPSATGTDAPWNSIDNGLAGFPSWDTSTAAASSSSQPTAASNAPLPSAGVKSVSSAAAASSSKASAADATFPWSSSDGDYSSISSFPSSTASSILVNKPSNISHTTSADYAHVSWAGPSNSQTPSAEYAHVSWAGTSKEYQTASAEYAHVSWSGSSTNYHTPSAEFAHVSLPASSTFATVTSGPSSRTRTLV
ncbi:MAG: hypothetical protein LQ350_007628 [Teloschistes chrysophthalmus]|nr:MAG: hypothetical protein LQ350_007628 [Niorma chrysophthalma]